MNKYLFPTLLLIVFTSCVSSKKYKLKIAEYEAMKASYEKVDYQLNACLDEKKQTNEKLKSVETELAYVKSVSTTLLKQLNDLSVVTNAQAESIKKSLDNISSKDNQIKNLHSEISRKDSLNMLLVLNLKGALKDVNDKDVQIKVEGTAVFISISDKLLFKSGSYDITNEAQVVLGKVAAVIKAQPKIQFMVEGHTDNQPITKSKVKDNWDLSVLRSTAVVRVLQKDFGIEPNRMIAAGRGEYLPVASNDTDESKALNRRTRIVIIPELDQFFKLMEPK